jgi:hypothetical protein
VLALASQLLYITYLTTEAVREFLHITLRLCDLFACQVFVAVAVLLSANSCFTYMYTVAHFNIKVNLHKTFRPQISADYLGMHRMAPCGLPSARWGRG